MSVTESTPSPSAYRAGKYFDDFSVGESWVSPARTITETDIAVFAGFSGDYHPLHTDVEYCKQTEFGGRIFHGPGVFAVATGLESRLGFKLETAIAFLGMTWTMKAPVYPGDTIRVTEAVASMRPSTTRPDRGIVTFDVAVVNQHGTVCQEGQWVVMFKRAEA